MDPHSRCMPIKRTKCQSREVKPKANENERDVRGDGGQEELTCQSHSPMIKLSGTLPYLNSHVLSGIHLKNWFMSCSPVIECGMWLMNCRLGWTVYGRRVTVSSYVMKRDVNVALPSSHETLGTSSNHPCSSNMEYVSQLYPFQGSTLTLSSNFSNGYVKPGVCQVQLS